MVAENLIYFEDLALSLGKDKKSFFHGVHKLIKPADKCQQVFWFYSIIDGMNRGK